VSSVRDLSRSAHFRRYFKSDKREHVEATRQPDLAVLIHGFAWASSKTAHALGPGISIAAFAGTAVENWYQLLCNEEGLDDFDPYRYEVMLRITANEGLEYGEPFSRVERICNLITVLTKAPVGMWRVLISRDDFRSAPSASTVEYSVGQTEFLNASGFVPITDETAGELQTAWEVSDELWRVQKSRGRFANALMFFYSAWKSHYMEHICLNLAIALEVLFAPHSQGEVSHQIAFNISRFMSKDAAERERIYRMTRKFYSVRSAIVHGGLPDDDKTIDITVPMFATAADVLRRIALDRDLAKTIDDETARVRLLNHYLFA
jgi:hypothetical protein